MADARVVLSADDRASAVLRHLRKEFSAVGGEVSTLRGALGTLGPSFAAAFSVAGVLGLTKSVVNGLDKLNDLADATGASVENLSALEDIAERTGTSVDTMGDAIVKMNKALADAKPGTDQAAVFQALGLSIAELKALDPVEAFQKIAIALQGFANDGNKARVVQELFGKSLREVAPLLKDVAEAGRLNATVTKEQAEEAEKFNKQLFALGKNATDAGRALVGPLVSALNNTAEAYKRAREEGVGFLEFTLRRIGQDNRPGSGAEEADRAQRKQQAIADLQRIDALLPKMAADRRDELIAERAIVQAKLAAIRVNEALAGAGDIAQDPALRRTPSLQLPPDELFMLDQLGLLKDKAAAKAANERVRLAEFSARQILEIEEQTAKDTAEAWKVWEGQQIDLSKERVEAEKEQWRQFFEFIDQQQEQAIEEGQAVLDAAEKSAGGWSVFAEQAARNIQDALGNTLEATLGGHFDGIGQMWKNMLIRMASEAAGAQLGKALFGDFGGKGGGELGGLVGLLLKQIPKFDVGTPYVPQDMIAMVHKGERIIPASKNTANGAPGAAPMVFHNTYNVGAGVPLSQVVAVVQAGNRTLEAKILRSRRRDGAFAS